MKRIVADPAKCMACRACGIACALAHAEGEDLVEAILEGARPRVYVEAAGKLAVPLQCRHCEDAPCVRVCPSGALSRAGEDEPVLVDQDRCIGCAFCVQVCPFGVIRLAGRGKAMSADRQVAGLKAVIKCDLCASLRAEGREPACVTACPVGALSFEEVEASAKRTRARAAAAAACEGKR